MRRNKYQAQKDECTATFKKKQMVTVTTETVMRGDKPGCLTSAPQLSWVIQDHERGAIFKALNKQKMGKFQRPGGFALRQKGSSEVCAW